MCGRYEVPAEGRDPELDVMLLEAGRRQQALTGENTISRGEITPGTVVAALAAGRAGLGAYPMFWGFAHPFGKGLLINVRSETALDKEMFREPMLHRRCLIPAACYYEWQKLQSDGEKLKIKYAIRPVSAERMYIAAIYRYEEGKKLTVLSILTRDAAPGISFIHPRMPVIVPESLREVWLDRASDPDRLLALCLTDMACKTCGQS